MTAPETLDRLLRSFPGAEHDYKAEWGWVRYQVRGRLFAAVCSPGPEHRAVGGHTLVNLKCDPRLAEGFREQYPHILPGFYCDKRHWIAVLLDGDVPEEVLADLCALSYRLVVEKLPKYVQRELAAVSEKE
ncbi:MmcQ/YjbR family DNA-binding protein [Pseudoflavonifractor sp. MSJ-37]|uniref:MmcQ/YjbR family DNA-binding protein n=1 Tax=Pseudoflavonifractor sp. MSJ-37 TaxID=2841531 RepID=UPI001C11FC59|nr:MmcQ/YjbR family DNA-binding protein [Pseudoflavonifractor sp. MSJ-37]MBU5434115.1 MmcQ/YjbR family DNA-binding protein [Pseudoflavonifractor sp. MSJ-37]